MTKTILRAILGALALSAGAALGASGSESPPPGGDGLRRLRGEVLFVNSWRNYCVVAWRAADAAPPVAGPVPVGRAGPEEEEVEPVVFHGRQVYHMRGRIPRSRARNPLPGGRRCRIIPGNHTKAMIENEVLSPTLDGTFRQALERTPPGWGTGGLASHAGA